MNGTEKTVDRSIVFQPIADVVKLELVADSNFIGRHWSVVEWRTLLGTPIRCDCWRIDEKTFRVTFLSGYIVRQKCNEVGLKRDRSMFLSIRIRTFQIVSNDPEDVALYFCNNKFLFLSCLRIRMGRLEKRHTKYARSSRWNNLRIRLFEEFHCHTLAHEQLLHQRRAGTFDFSSFRLCCRRKISQKNFLKSIFSATLSPKAISKHASPD